MNERRSCAWCLEPLPVDARWNAVYHADPCRKLAHREQIRESNRRWMRRRKAAAPRRQRNPMLYLGMDYVMLKLGETHAKE